jgi:putative membrane protein
LGWGQLRVEGPGHPAHDEGSRTSRKDLLPVGSTAEALYLAQLVLGHQGPPATKPPHRARFKAPLSYHFLEAGHDSQMITTSTGRLTRTTVWLRLEKVQSVRYVQGPVQRRLKLADVHADAAGRRVHATFRDRDATQAETLVHDLARYSRTARQNPGATFPH